MLYTVECRLEVGLGLLGVGVKANSTTTTEEPWEEVD
jgi:hypothetical protein